MDALKNTVSGSDDCKNYGTVSVIMPSYNTNEYLRETVNSVLSQTYENWELIIVDDCSSDNSLEILREYAERDPRIKVIINESNMGAAVSRNKAIDLANGRWIAFLDSDDLWNENKLLHQLSFMSENAYAFSFTHYYFDRNDGNLKEFAPSKDVYDYRTILKHNYIACPTVIYDSEKLGKVYMPVEADKREDFGCWLTILKRGINAYCLHEILTTVKIHEGSVSYSKVKMVKYQWNVYRKVENISLLRSVFYMIHWAIKGFFKYRK